MRIIIGSNNEHLFSLLNKNPKTDFGLYAFELNGGVAVGRTAEDSYIIDFFTEDKHYGVDPTNRIDYLYLTRPKIILDIVDKMFGEILHEKWLGKNIPWLDNKTNTELDNSQVLVYVPRVFIDSSWVRDGKLMLSKYLKGVSIEHKKGHIYALTIKSRDLFDAINQLMVVAMFLEFTNDYQSNYFDDKFVDKYLRILTNVENVPYFIFYLFSMKMAKSEKIYENILSVAKEYLLKQHDDMNITLRPTQHIRLKNAVETLGLDLPILDYGCGEFDYFKRFCKEGLKHTYYAYDLDKTLYHIGNAINRRFPDNKLVLLEDGELPKEKVNVLISEVVEHMEEEEAAEVLQNIIDKVDFEMLMFTTPNREFNKHYSLEGEMRHKDHKFEFDLDGLYKFCTKLKGVSFIITNLGDEIDGQSSSFAVKLKKVIV